MSRLLCFLLCVLLLPVLLIQAAFAASEDGKWRLNISGHHRFVFGDRVLHGFVQIPWEVSIEFAVRDGVFQRGVGSARWIDKVSTGSRPQGWISCELEEGSYLDAGLHLREMPRVRFAAFPLSGELADGVLKLQPGYQLPGNYLAIRYHCVTEQPAAVEWFLFASRSRNEEGKRQDAELRESGSHREASINEVQVLPPEEGLSLPLRDGWYFQQGDPQANYYARYSLQRLTQ